LYENTEGDLSKMPLDLKALLSDEFCVARTTRLQSELAFELQSGSVLNTKIVKIQSLLSQNSAGWRTVHPVLTSPDFRGNSPAALSRQFAIAEDPFIDGSKSGSDGPKSDGSDNFG
jgi:hypothetical protein